MNTTQSNRLCIVIITIGITTFSVMAKKPIRDDFFDQYPAADNTQLIDLPSNSPHCGVCHFDFNGGGARNPYGAAIEAERASNGNDSAAAFIAIESEDSDGDGFSNFTEITDTITYTNTPTFPGLSSANDDLASNVDPADIEPHLFPATGEDTTPPTVAVLSPDGGETATGNDPLLIQWSASDSGSGLSGIELYISLDNGSTWKHITKTLPGNATSFEWFVSNRPSSNALVRVEAYDNAGNENSDSSDSVFYIVSPGGGIAPTTLRDFDQPGSQPIDESGLVQADPDSCGQCHGGYDELTEPYRNWMGSMMAQASIDPIFKANMAIANQDAPDSGDLCLRCHNSRGWLDGRSTPTDGSQMNALDQRGVSCDLCHRLVDPIYDFDISPSNDVDVLNELADVPAHFGNGMYVFDPNSHRRGPFNDTDSPHTDLYSPFHRESDICGTCHDVSNPVFVRDGANAEYVNNDFDAPATNYSPEILMPVERTFSEWKHSAYNTTNGVFAPQFAGNKNGGMVASCQDCHMPDIAGYGANTNLYPTAPLRNNLPLHDMTGGSSWLSRILPEYAGLDAQEGAALSNGAVRAEYMLRKAARMKAEVVDGLLRVTVINDTGHKLPTGYPEGRRIWVNLRFYDNENNLLAEHGGYDYATGVLTNESTIVYEVHPGIGTNLASILDIEPGPSLHFVLNNQIYEDNRIPPRGFTNSVFDTFGGAPVGHEYADGQYWDDEYFSMPEGAVRAHARLYYQSTSKEFIDFLRDENKTTSHGQELYDLWVENDRCPPVLMTEAFWPENLSIHNIAILPGDAIEIAFNSISGYTYWIEFADVLNYSTAWTPFSSNGRTEAIGETTIFTDDYTTATSGEIPPDGTRFYRIKR